MPGTARKLTVPKPSKATFASALKVANGEGTAADAARVRRVRDLADCGLVFAARCVCIRWFWHCETEWYG